MLEGRDETLTVTLTHASTTAGTVRLGTPTTATTTIGAKRDKNDYCWKHDGDGTVTVDVDARRLIGDGDGTVTRGGG